MVISSEATSRIAAGIVNTGIIGYGSSGQHLHTPLLVDNPNFNIKAVATDIPANLSNLPEQAKAMAPDALINDPDIALIVVATPNNSHYHYAKAALMQKKHVVVEKPLALEAQQISELKALAKEHDRVLAVFHNRLWDCDFLAVQKLLKSGVLGKLHSYRTQVDRYWPEVVDNWRDDPDYGGAVWELAPNLLVQTQLLFGKPTRLFAEIATQRPQAKAPDAFYIRLSYPGLDVELRCSSLVAHSGPRYLIHGDRGSYSKMGIDPQHKQLKQGMLPSDKNYGKEPIEEWGSLYCDGRIGEEELYPSPNGDYPAFYRQLYKAIAHGEPVPVDIDMAFNVVDLIEAAYRSSREGKVIEL